MRSDRGSRSAWIVYGKRCGRCRRVLRATFGRAASGRLAPVRLQDDSQSAGRHWRYGRLAAQRHGGADPVRWSWRALLAIHRSISGLRHGAASVRYVIADNYAALRYIARNPIPIDVFDAPGPVIGPPCTGRAVPRCRQGTRVVIARRAAASTVTRCSSAATVLSTGCGRSPVARATTSNLYFTSDFWSDRYKFVGLGGTSSVSTYTFAAAPYYRPADRNL